MSASWKVQRLAWSTVILTRKSIYIKAPSSLFSKCPEKQSVIVVYSVFLAAWKLHFAFIPNESTFPVLVLASFSSALTETESIQAPGRPGIDTPSASLTRIQEIFMRPPQDFRGPRDPLKPRSIFSLYLLTWTTEDQSQGWVFVADDLTWTLASAPGWSSVLQNSCPRIRNVTVFGNMVFTDISN